MLTPRPHQRNPFRPTPGVEPPYLVGRDAELSLLTVGLSATADHDPAIPTVLLRHAIADAKERGGIVIAAKGRPRDFLNGRVRDGLEAAQRSAEPIPDRVRCPHDAGSIGLTEPERPEAKRFTVELRERWRYLSIGQLTLDQTREAIRKPILDAGHQIADDALEALAESAGYPYFIQRVRIGGLGTSPTDRDHHARCRCRRGRRSPRTRSVAL